jgi:Spy/CpxP family protein refolding chaperone
MAASLGALVLMAPVLAAQGGPPSGPPGSSARRPNYDGAQRAQELERQFRERLDSLVRVRLQLTDEQHSRLREVASRTEQERRNLRGEEVRIRLALRRELMAGDKANEARVAELLDQVPVLERRRLEVSEQELKELSRFLTAVQRARYFALQEQLRWSMQDVQRTRMGDGKDERDRRDTSSSRRRSYQRPPGDR